MSIDSEFLALNEMWKYAGHFTKPSRVFSTSNKVSGPRKRDIFLKKYKDRVESQSSS